RLGTRWVEAGDRPFTGFAPGLGSGIEVGEMPRAVRGIVALHRRPLPRQNARRTAMSAGAVSAGEAAGSRERDGGGRSARSSSAGVRDSGHGQRRILRLQRTLTKLGEPHLHTRRALADVKCVGGGRSRRDSAFDEGIGNSAGIVGRLHGARAYRAERPTTSIPRNTSNPQVRLERNSCNASSPPLG